MAEKKQCYNINVFKSKAKYDENLENIAENDINLIKDETEYVTKAEFDQLKAVVKTLQNKIAGA